MSKNNKAYTSVFSILLFFVAGAFAHAADKDYLNPGGKWMPHQIEQHAEVLKKLGLEIDPKELSQLDSGLLRAIVSLGFCSGSFISPDGLIITNHHCVQGMLSYMSQVDNDKGIKSDYVTNGFLARTRQEERSAGPTQKIFITTKIDNVTDEILRGTEDIADPVMRVKEIEKRIKELTKSRENGRPNVRVTVAPYYRGAKYFVIEQLELKDIRVVYAPPKGVGFFGGDTDNWHWPRHTGDFALIRAYVGTDGSSAELHANNVPYRNERFLKVSRAGTTPYDLVFVAGYPGSTTRLNTAAEVRDQMTKYIPDGLKFWKDLKNLLDALSKTDKSIDIKTESKRFSLANVIKKNDEALNALSGIAFLKTKADQEKDFLDWANTNVNRNPEWPNAIADVLKVKQKYAYLNDDVTVDRLAGHIDLIGSAIDIVRLAEERQKPDSEREIAYQQRNWSRYEQAEKKKQTALDSKVAFEVLNLILARANDNEKASEALRDLFENRGLLSETKLWDLNVRLDLVRNATPETLASSQDPLIKLALALVPGIKARENASRAFSGEMKPAMRRYIEALEAYSNEKGQGLAPDANSTLRVTYGQVKGYRSRARNKSFAPYTNIQELLSKHKVNDGEFEVPYNVQQAAARGNFEHYADPIYGTLPINFLAGVDTTGGNSGSAAINARGELVGLLFDGNEDTLYSDWYYDDREVRSILLDIRYFLWTLDEVEKAHNLMREMTITPTCEHLFTEKLSKGDK